MGMRTLEALLLVAAVAALVVALGAGWEALRIERWNAVITTGGVQLSDSQAAPVRVRFAAAYELGRRGQIQEALNAYREFDSAADPAIRRNAKFNSANLYLQAALAARADNRADPSAALTLMELAKQSYREVLREHSGDWVARYNLEEALRLDPDPDTESPELSTPPSRIKAPMIGLGSDLGLP